MTLTLKTLKPDDWQDLKTIRLEALRNHPDLFAPSRDETQFTENDWRGGLRNPQRAYFGLYDGNAIVGLTGIVVAHGNPARAIMIASYIRAEHRRKGISSLFYQARIDWAKARPAIKVLETGFMEGNEASFRANQKFGFQFSRTYEYVSLSGKTMTCHAYELDMTSQGDK